MPDVWKMFSLLASLFLVLSLISNIMPKWPKIPGDIYINRPGIKIYIPWLSSLVLSVLITLIFNFFKN